MVPAFFLVVQRKLPAVPVVSKNIPYAQSHRLQFFASQKPVSSSEGGWAEHASKRDFWLQKRGIRLIIEEMSKFAEKG